MNLKIGDLVLQNDDNLGMIVDAQKDDYIVEWYGNKDVSPYTFRYSTFIMQGFRREYMKFRKWI
jgi:hypothetical protein